MLHRPFCFTSGEDILDFVPSLSVPVQAALPYDSPRAAVTDEEMECDFLSAQEENSADNSDLSRSDMGSSGNDVPPVHAETHSSPLRRSTRERREPPKLVYDEDFRQELIQPRTTKHQQRKPPTPVKKHPSRENRDKVKLKRGRSIPK